MRYMPMVPVTCKLTDREVRFLNAMVLSGRARSRSDAIHKLVAKALESECTRPVRSVDIDLEKARRLSEAFIKSQISDSATAPVP